MPLYGRILQEAKHSEEGIQQALGIMQCSKFWKLKIAADGYKSKSKGNLKFSGTQCCWNVFKFKKLSFLFISESSLQEEHLKCWIALILISSL